MSAENLLSPRTIRERCLNITTAVANGHSQHFRIRRELLDTAAQCVADLTRSRFPDGRIPYHSRWRHFEAGGIDRSAELDRKLVDIFGSPSSVEIARARIDLTVVSVLLDAGAGDRWHFHDSRNGLDLARSEGLGVASFRAFMGGAFSSRPEDPCRVDGIALQKIDANALAHVFQAHGDNPLVGLEHRVTLLNRLGEVMLRDPARFGPDARPGEIFIRLTDKGRRTELSAADILHALLTGLNDIWLTGQQLQGAALGDAWRHRFAGGTGPGAGWVPFHKLTQWLTYSLFEPFEGSGVKITGRDELTALPEYRNGGLLIDTGVLELIDPALAEKPQRPGDEAVVEWRALTVSLIDELAPSIRARLGLDAQQMPLARVLEGGTWAAGRALAEQRRNGRPPMHVISDGTVF